MKIEGIILAAGLSSRVGINKLVLELDGITIIEKCLINMYDYCSRIIVVGGIYIEDIDFIAKKYTKVELVYNQDYMLGMFNSVKTGLKYLNGDRFFLTPGDYPMIDKTTYDAMLKVNKDIIVPIYNGEKGHPVLINTLLVDEILYDSNINSLRDFIEKKGSTTLTVVDPGILLDVDTFEDYRELKGGY